MDNHAEYWQLIDRRDLLFRKWFRQEVSTKKGKTISFWLWREYMRTLHQAQAIAPPVDDVWAGHTWRGR
jgi:hypothetical protein